MILRLLSCLLIASVVLSDTSQNFDALNSSFDRKRPKCERITAEHCANIGYNETRFPNFARDENAEAAIATLNGFSPLIGTKCNPEIAFFLCSVYFPMCTEKVPDPIGPCKPLCLRIQKDCAPLLNEFKYSWPPALDCDQFPAVNDGKHMCMPGLARTSSEEVEELEEKTPVNNNYHFTKDIESLSNVVNGKCSMKDWVYVNKTAECVPTCATTLDFTLTEITTARSTLVVGSMISVCFTTICIVASCIRGSVPLSARKPIDKSLFFCTFCFALSAGFYAFSLLLKDKIACIEYNDSLLYAVRGLPNTKCTFMAALLYYFGSVGRLWWLMICIAWRWNMKEHSLAEMDTFIFRAHIVCWALPLFLLTMALMAQSVHPELVSGVCLVGSASHPQYQIFIALRELLIMLAAFLVLFSGCLNSVHNSIRSIASTSPSAGCIGFLYPLAALFLLISSFQSHYNPLLGRWTPLAAFQLLADPALGTLIGSAYFVYILYSCYQTGTIGSRMEKNGYFPPNAVQVTSNGHGLSGTTTTCVTGPQMVSGSLYHQVSVASGGVPTSIGTYYSAGGFMAPPPTNVSPPAPPNRPVPQVPSS